MHRRFTGNVDSSANNTSFILCLRVFCLCADAEQHAQEAHSPQATQAMPDRCASSQQRMFSVAMQPADAQRRQHSKFQEDAQSERRSHAVQHLKGSEPQHQQHQQQWHHWQSTSTALRPVSQSHSVQQQQEHQQQQQQQWQLVQPADWQQQQQDVYDAQWQPGMSTYQALTRLQSSPEAPACSLLRPAAASMLQQSSNSLQTQAGLVQRASGQHGVLPQMPSSLGLPRWQADLHPLQHAGRHFEAARVSPVAHTMQQDDVAVSDHVARENPRRNASQGLFSRLARTCRRQRHARGTRTQPAG